MAVYIPRSSQKINLSKLALTKLVFAHPLDRCFCDITLNILARISRTFQNFLNIFGGMNNGKFC